MDIKSGYDLWAGEYDKNKNKTRDLEEIVIREVLKDIPFDKVLEIGCGTGKNTAWLAGRAKQVVAADQSEKMISLARNKLRTLEIEFVVTDILQPWPFEPASFDLLTCSLVLEHIEDLEPVFGEVTRMLKPGGWCYVGELHPYKQYAGTKARFVSGEDEITLTCYDHHVSDFFLAARKAGLDLIQLKEHFDEGKNLPRIISFLWKKNERLDVFPQLSRQGQ